MNFNGGSFWGSSGSYPGNLLIGGDLQVQGVIKASDGTQSAPSYTFTNEDTTGFYRSGSGSMSYVASGSTGATFSSTGIATVGLDAETLDVSTDAKIVGSMEIDGSFTAMDGYFDGDLEITGKMTAVAQPMMKRQAPTQTFAKGTPFKLDFDTFVDSRGSPNGVIYNTVTKEFSVIEDGYYTIDTTISFADVGDGGFRAVGIETNYSPFANISYSNQPCTVAAATNMALSGSAYLGAGTTVWCAVNSQGLNPNQDVDGFMTIIKFA
jgi:hypothetical protein